MKTIDWDDVGYETHPEPALKVYERELVQAQARYIDAKLAEEIRVILDNPLYDS